MKELDDYSIEELLIYCAKRAGNERIASNSGTFKHYYGQVYQYTRKAALEIQKYKLDRIIDGELEI